MKQVDPGVEYSLYVDDFVIMYKSLTIDAIQRKLQHWSYVAHSPFSRDEDICHGLAFHAITDGLPNSLCIISINKWRYRLGISNSVQGIWTERHMLQGFVLLFVVDDFQQTILVPSEPW